MKSICTAGFVAAAIAISFCVGCSSDSPGGSSLVAPTMSELINAWNAVRRTTTSSETMDMSEQVVDSTDTAILFIGPEYIYTYSQPRDSSCYCVDSIAYSIAGNQVIIDEPQDELPAGSYQITWSLQGGQLVFRTQVEEQGTEDDVTYSYDYDMSATYAPYTGQRPPALCADCTEYLYKAAAHAAASSIQGWWIAKSMSGTYTESESETELFAAPGLIYEFRSDSLTGDSVYVYEYDTARNAGCYGLTKSDFALVGTSLTGAMFSGSDTGWYGELEQYSTTASMSGSQLVLTTTMTAMGGDGGYDIDASMTETVYLETYTDTVPPAEWPQTRCWIWFKAQADADRSRPPSRSPISLPSFLGVWKP